MRIQHEVRSPRDFAKRGDALPIPNLVRVQQDAYVRFLQKEVPADERKNEGLETLLREVFPIESYDGNLRLEYVSYDLSRAPVHAWTSAAPCGSPTACRSASRSGSSARTRPTSRTSRSTSARSRS